MPHRKDVGEHHVHNEVGALLAAVRQEGPTHKHVRVLAKVDASATVAAVRKAHPTKPAGSGPFRPPQATPKGGGRAPKRERGVSRKRNTQAETGQQTFLI